MRMVPRSLNAASASAETETSGWLGEAHFFAARSPLDVPRLSELARIGKRVVMSLT